MKFRFLQDNTRQTWSWAALLSLTSKSSTVKRRSLWPRSPLCSQDGLSIQTVSPIGTLPAVRLDRIGFSTSKLAVIDRSLQRSFPRYSYFHETRSFSSRLLSGSALGFFNDEQRALGVSTTYEWDTILVWLNSVTYDLNSALGPAEEIRYGRPTNPHYPPSLEY